MGNPPVHRARKRFGQHFLHDQHIIQRILDSANPLPGETIVEIGPGQGALTLPLLKRCHKLTAVELDRDLIKPLQQKAISIGELELINQDVLTFDINDVFVDQKIRVIGNLPYNISTPLMFHLNKANDVIADMHFMVQKEVAKRIVAGPGDKNYGRLSVMMQYANQCHYLFDVPPSSFKPPPKVDSAIIRLLPIEKAKVDVGDFELFASIVKSAFEQRRKTLSNSLRNIVSPEIFEESGISKSLRAEKLDLQAFATLSRLTGKS